MGDLARARESFTSPELASKQPRKSERIGAAVTFVVSTGPSGRLKATLTDISEHGCSLRLEEGDLRLGQIVALRVCLSEDLSAVTRWIRDGQAGLEFFRPLPPALVDRLAERR